MAHLLPSCISLLPPFVVLCIGIITHRVNTALIVGLVLAALCATGGAIVNALSLLGHRLWQTSDLGSLAQWNTVTDGQTLLVFLFLINLGILVALLSVTGCARAYAATISQKLHSARDVEQASLLLSMALFIDDYFSTLTTGTLMRPLADRFKVPPVKLAFLVDSMAAPVAILIPLSSWVAVIVGQLQRAGITESVTVDTVIVGDPFVTYLSFIPYVLYSFVLMASAWFIVRRRISFGPMREHELRMIIQETPTKQEETIEISTAVAPTLFDFIAPIALFMIVVVIGMLMSGGYSIIGQSCGLIQALRNAKASIALAGSSTVSLAITMLFLLWRRLLKITQIPAAIKEGVVMMTPAMIVLFLCWTFGIMLTTDLNTGSYLAGLFSDTVPLWTLPCLFFVVSSIISFALGSSWGTLGIVIPIAVPMILRMLDLAAPVSIESVPLLIPILGAIVSGAVLGDHVSPLSDTTIMSSASSGSVHIEHVYTQFFYVAPVFVATATAFLALGIFPALSWLASSLIGAGISCTLLTLLNKGLPDVQPEISRE